MAKIKFDVRDSDPDEAVKSGNFEQPKPGVYKGKLLECESGFAKDEATGKPDKSRPLLICKYQITDKKAGNGDGAWLWDRVSFSDAAKWKLDQFLQAFGLADKKKRTGTFDTDTIIGDPCVIRVKGGTYNKEYKAEVGAVLAADPDAEDDDANDDTTDETVDDVVDDDDDLTGTDDDETSVETDETTEFPYYEMEELAGMQIAGLKQVAEDLEIEPPKAKQANRVALSKWIFENQPAEAPEEGEGDADADAEGETPEDGYDDLEIAELKQECKDRGLAAGGNKAALIARLREDDQEEPF
jgi:hypothetical protein